MARTVFTDFDEFADAISGIAGCIVPTARSESDWWVDVVQIGRVTVRRFQIGGAAAFAGNSAANTLTIGIPIDPTRGMRIDGRPVDGSSLVLPRPGAPFTFAASQPTRWAGISVPMDHPQLPFDLQNSAHAGGFADGDSALKRTDPQHVERGRQLVSRLCEGTHSGKLTDSAIGSFEEEVVAWSARALQTDCELKKQRAERPRYSRHRVLGEALSLMARSANEPLHMEDLCRATQVSERVLRDVFREYFNVGPARLLKVQQLHSIRVALIDADPAAASVSAIAARFGVWDHSLFARHYKALYGESPSATLRRSRQRRSAQPTDNGSGNGAKSLFANLQSYADHGQARAAGKSFGTMLPQLSDQVEALILQQRKLTQGIKEHEAQLRTFAKWVREISRSQLGETWGNA